MFLGTHPLRLDDKHRLFLPARHRAALAEGVVVTPGREGCLYLFARADFAAKAAALSTSQASGAAVRNNLRVFFASASDETPDKSGRITVPQHLREYAGLERDVVVTGNNDRLEVWSAQAWAALEASAEQAFAGTDVEVLPGFV